MEGLIVCGGVFFIYRCQLAEGIGKTVASDRLLD